jgi:hypothetical protein
MTEPNISSETSHDERSVAVSDAVSEMPVHEEPGRGSADTAAVPEVLGRHGSGRFRRVSWNIPEDLYRALRLTHEQARVMMDNAPASEQDFALHLLLIGCVVMQGNIQTERARTSPIVVPRL